MTRIEKQRAERQRIRALIHNYCFKEQRGRGCARCPVNKAEVCGFNYGTAEAPMEKLREAESIIMKEREATT